jgi:acyl transferase domain-containing protein
MPGIPAAHRSQDGFEKLAVIGMSGRYPQADNLEEYWQNLATAKNSIVGIPGSRWDADAYFDADPDAEGKMYCRSMGILDNADAFDPRFFRITPQEALYMDPEQRLFLQEGYRALEDAGYVGSDADGSGLRRVPRDGKQRVFLAVRHQSAYFGNHHRQSFGDRRSRVCRTS